MTENEKIFKLQDVVVALVSMSEDIVSKEEFERIDDKGVEIINCLDELKRWRTSRINENIKNPFANMSTSICHNCDHKDEYIEELEAEVEECHSIGTIEEFKALKEKREDCVIKHLTNECSYNETGCSGCKGKETICVAVKRMKPKKPTHQGCYDEKGVWHTWNGINGVPYDLCPN